MHGRADRFTGGVQEIVEETISIERLGLGEVVDGAGQDVQAIPQRIELGAGHDELVLAQAQLGGALPRLVVALAARAPAIAPGPTGSARGRELLPAPGATR